MAWIDMKGPITADTVLVNGEVVARDTAFTLPSITQQTSDYQGMGTISLPTPGLFDSMELSITKIGIDRGLSAMARIGSLDIELRWVQTTIKANGESKPEGCKAFLKVVSKSIPGTSVTIGSAAESTPTFEALRYRMIVGGEELWLIDRLAQICRIGGTDYYDEIMNLL